VPDDSNRPKQNGLVLAARYSEIGFIIPAAVLLGYGLGWLLDRAFQVHWLNIAGVIFGAIAGFIQMIRMVSRLNRDSAEPDDSKSP